MNYLEFYNISKKFPGVQALQDVSFGIAQGTIHGLIGENGAGKSTLVKILSGFYHSDQGNIIINKEPQSFATPFDALRAKINVIHQELQLIPNQTVAENITLGHYTAEDRPFIHGIVSWKKLFVDVQKFLTETEIDIDERAKINELTIGQQQMVEIAKAIHRDAKIIAFDEPTSSLSKLESDLLFKIIKKLRDEGKVIIYISHRMAEIFDLCDACTVLKDGKHVATHLYSEDKLDLGDVIDREILIKEMTGKSLRNVYEYRKRSIGDIILKADAVTGPGLSAPCSLHVCSGEIVGLFGLIGAGRSELVQLIYGSAVKTNGTISVNNLPITRCRVKSSINAGVMFCTEDRKKEGIINGRSIWENINISSRRHFSILHTLLNMKQEMHNAEKQVHELNVKTPSLDQDIVNLSGGNQQKVILGRWLSERGMKVLIVDEPTRGIDIGSKHEIYSILYDLAESGIGIIMVSSELPEIIGICDRLYIMREGEISKEIDRDKFNEAFILEYAFPHEVQTQHA